MKTRTLIALALACGLAILLAGGVFVVTLASNKDDLTVRDVRSLGDVVTVGGLRVGVLAASSVDDTAVVRVVVDARAASGSIGDAARPWTYVAGSRRAPRDVPAGEGEPCAGRSVGPGGLLECMLAFDKGDGTGYLEFSFGEREERWLVRA